jgi:hypothetical protein
MGSAVNDEKIRRAGVLASPQLVKWYAGCTVRELFEAAELMKKLLTTVYNEENNA